METQDCPNCGHENLSRAVFCFQCGARLDHPPIVRGIHQSQRHVEDAMRYLQGREDVLPAEVMQNLREVRAKLPPSMDGEPLTCLHCGTLNRPQASFCVGCGRALTMPDDAEPARLVARAAARSDVGQLRENNEDRVGLWARGGVVLALVADGMGGAAAGEEASRLAMEAVQADFLGQARGSEILDALPEDEIAEKLRVAVRRANRAVIHRTSEHPEFQGMGTTITLAFVRDRHAIFVHVGDSRAYLVKAREGWINQVTDDHSFVEALLAAGHITPEQAAIHPMRNVLCRALGQFDDADADIYARTLEEGDRVILCSDGLTRHVSAEEIAAIASDSEEPAAITQALVDLANARGGQDNVSVIALIMERAEDRDQAERPEASLVDATQIGLYQAPVLDVESLERKTLELPAVQLADQESPADTGDEDA